MDAIQIPPRVLDTFKRAVAGGKVCPVDPDVVIDAMAEIDYHAAHWLMVNWEALCDLLVALLKEG